MNLGPERGVTFAFCYPLIFPLPVTLPILGNDFTFAGIATLSLLGFAPSLPLGLIRHRGAWLNQNVADVKRECRSIGMKSPAAH